MEQHIFNAMNDDIIKEAGMKYGVAFKDIKKLGGFENFIYEFVKDSNEYVIRFVHSTHRNFEQVYAELEFIDFLSKNGANVSTVVHTLEDEMLFQIDTENNEFFIVCVFTKAPGTYVKKTDINEQFNEMFGEAVGKMHRLTKSYNPIHKRQQFYEDDFIDLGKKHLPVKHHFVIDRAIELVDKLKTYETDIDSYGLIHTDLHFGNMYYDQEKITFYDFDDASYKHFISDIAIIIFYQFGLGELSDVEIEDKTISFLKSFMKGYNKENSLDLKWMKRMNDFLKLRELILFMVIHAAGPDMLENPFGKRFISKFESRIKNNIPFFDIDKVVKAVWNI